MSLILRPRRRHVSCSILSLAQHHCSALAPTKMSLSFFRNLNVSQLYNRRPSVANQPRTNKNPLGALIYLEDFVEMTQLQVKFMNIKPNMFNLNVTNVESFFF